MLSANTVVIKEVNKELVRNQLKQLREATIHQLSQKTGLSVVTVNSLLAEMKETGEVFEGSMIPSNGGRPSILYAYNENFRLAVVIYGYQKKGSNLIHFLVVNLFGECVERREVYIPDVEVESFCPYIDEAVQKYPTVGAIGFGLPGSEENGIILSNDYKQLVGSGFMQFYRERYGLPVVFVNDVNAAVNGYYASRENLKCVVGLYFPRIYLPGGGIIVNGQIHHGFRSFAGEFTGLPLGIDWLRLDYTDGAAVAEAVGRLLAAYCCMIAPEEFVLYGDFFTKESADRIRNYAQGLLPEYFEVWVRVSGNFEKDFETGTIQASLELLNDSFVISKKGI